MRAKNKASPSDYLDSRKSWGCSVKKQREVENNFLHLKCNSLQERGDTGQQGTLIIPAVKVVSFLSVHRLKAKSKISLGKPLL